MTKESAMTTTTTHAPLTRLDRCDRCGAAARVRAVLASGGDLLFCEHHARRHSVQLAEIAATLYPSEA